MASSPPSSTAAAHLDSRWSRSWKARGRARAVGQVELRFSLRRVAASLVTLMLLLVLLLFSICRLSNCFQRWRQIVVRQLGVTHCTCSVYVFGGC